MMTPCPAPNTGPAETMRPLPALALVVSLAALAPSPMAAGNADADPRIQAMKEGARGPFARIRWFCKDGSILEPQPYGCKEHGGGSQHGQWSDTTTRLRDAGFYIANVYADLDIEALLAGDPVGERLGQMLVEQHEDEGMAMNALMKLSATKKRRGYQSSSKM